MSESLHVNIEIDGFTRIHFEKRELKKAIRKGGNVVLKESRRLISSRAISGSGQFPGMDSGTMRKAIKVKVGSGGGYVRVMPYMTEEMRAKTMDKNGKSYFYPAFLYYGTSRGLRPRKDFMVAALDNKQAEIRAAISQALRDALRSA